jgi:TPP-dependent pyruvate/acetoin dehydrogenase alpha subunit
MTITKETLLEFEKKVKEVYEEGKILAPIHLSGNNEDILIEIFKNIDRDDWVFSSWRNHYHALLHGIDEDELFNKILDGRSMSINSKDRNFYSSSIVGGIIPIALGAALALKRNKAKKTVWCFIGDMTFETGIFHECYKYSRNFDLPLKFVVEDNDLSTNTPTEFAWNKKSTIPKDIIYYKYERLYPHHGTGSWVLF